MASLEYILIGGSALLMLSVIASKATVSLGVPSLLVFLGIGMMSGSEGVGGIYFDNASYAQTLGVVSLVYILFSGGLETDIKKIRPVFGQGALLATVGILVTCVLTGWFSTLVLKFSWLEGLLLGAIVSSTDAAAVFTVLRGKSFSLKGRLSTLLELESGANDPMAVLLTVGFLHLMTDKNSSLWELIPDFLRQIFLGTLIGVAAGKGLATLLNRIKLEFDGLYPVMTLASVVLVYGFTQAMGGSGFLAVYLAGIILGNGDFIHKKSLMLFHEGIAWLMQIGMFLVLGLLVFPSRLLPVAGMGLLASAFLIFVARPLSVFISLFRTSLDTSEKAVISWVGLRGSVPIILSTYALLAGIDRADEIFHLVFFIVITSVLVQGTTIPWVAKLFKVAAVPVKPKNYSVEDIPSGELRNELTEIELLADSPVIGKSIVELRLPKEALIVLIHRRGDVVVPKGGTHLELGDMLLVLAKAKTLNEVKRILLAV